MPKDILIESLEKIDYEGSIFDRLSQNGHIVSIQKAHFDQQC